MYTIYKENRKQIDYSQLKDLYKGKWLFLVNLVNFSYIDGDDVIFRPPEKCEVYVVADEPYEGAEEDIYDKIFTNAEDYGFFYSLDLRVQ